ncbi:MAG: hypothetical protein JNL47_07315 [Bacteroidia bacterium]|nr:hypothetical protein [Bacteroidia bacterium]
MELIEVKSKAEAKEFLHLPVKIYSHDPDWCRPLNQDIEAVFDEKKNKFFRHGQCTRWILRKDGEVIGRVAAFINHKTANKEPQPTGGMGFFECINSREAAFKLFDTCKEWLKQRGMEAMDGPINFGERDAWWGLLVDGFTPVPYKMNYNPRYYQSFFEEYGFKNYFEQWCYSIKVADRPQEKFYVRHAAISANPDFSSAHLKKNQLAKYAEDFRQVYNKAWVKHGSGKQLEQHQVLGFFKKMKPVMDEKIIWFVYHKGQPVGTWVNLPDINAIFRKFNGKFGWLEKLRFIYHLKRKKEKKMIGFVFGIIPEHQGKGVDAYLIVEAANFMQSKMLYDDLEMQWVGDFNPKMIAVCEDLGAWRSRTLITYRYLFDRNKEFKRHPVL